jgi:hypothetical protein
MMERAFLRKSEKALLRQRFNKSPLSDPVFMQKPIWKILVRVEVFTAVTMKNAVVWDVTPCGSCKNRPFGGTSVLTRATRRNIPGDGFFVEISW